MKNVHKTIDDMRFASKRQETRIPKAENFSLITSNDDKSSEKLDSNNPSEIVAPEKHIQKVNN